MPAKSGKAKPRHGPRRDVAGTVGAVVIVVIVVSLSIWYITTPNYNQLSGYTLSISVSATPYVPSSGSFSAILTPRCMIGHACPQDALLPMPPTYTVFWVFGDGITASGNPVNHIFLATCHSVTVTVTNGGSQSSASINMGTVGC